MNYKAAIFALEATHSGLRHLFRGLPFQRLTTKERQRLGGQQFRGDTDLTAEVVFGLRRAPELFPDAAGAADAIEGDAALAELWLSVALLLRALYVLAMDGHLYHSAEALTRSRQVLRNVSVGYENQGLCPHLDHGRRVNVMEYALRLAFAPFAARAKRRKSRVAEAEVKEKKKPSEAQRAERRGSRDRLLRATLDRFTALGRG